MTRRKTFIQSSHQPSGMGSTRASY